MSTYPANELLRLWSLGEVTPEQTIGHLVQHLVAITQRLSELEKRLRQLETAVSPTIASRPAGLAAEG